MKVRIDIEEVRLADGTVLYAGDIRDTELFPSLNGALAAGIASEVGGETKTPLESMRTK